MDGMKVVLAGEVYSPNLGDRVIADCLSEILKEIIPNVDLVLLDWAFRTEEFLSVNQSEYICKGSMINYFFRFRTHVHKRLKEYSPAYSSFLTNRSAKCQRKMGKMYYPKVIHEAELLVIGGGQLLMDNNLSFPTRLSELICQAEMYKVPVIFVGVGVGDAWSDKGRELVSRALRSPQVKSIGVRDPVSAKRLKHHFPEIAAPVLKGKDVALAAKNVYGDPVALKTNVIGVGLIDPHVVWRHKKSHPLSQKGIVKFWIDLCISLLKRGKKVCLFSNGEKGDQAFAELVMNKVGKRIKLCCGELRVARRPTTAVELVNLIKGFDGVVAARMHANIIAASLGVPGMGLVSDDKMSAFFASLEMELLAVVNFDNPKQVCDDLIELVEDHHYGVKMSDQWYCELINTVEKLLDFAR